MHEHVLLSMRGLLDGVRHDNGSSIDDDDTTEEDDANLVRICPVSTNFYDLLRGVHGVICNDGDLSYDPPLPYITNDTDDGNSSQQEQPSMNDGSGGSSSSCSLLFHDQWTVNNNNNVVPTTSLPSTPAHHHHAPGIHTPVRNIDDSDNNNRRRRTSNNNTGDSDEDYPLFALSPSPNKTGGPYNNHDELYQGYHPYSY